MSRYGSTIEAAAKHDVTAVNELLASRLGQARTAAKEKALQIVEEHPAIAGMLTDSRIARAYSVSEKELQRVHGQLLKGIRESANVVIGRVSPRGCKARLEIRFNGSQIADIINPLPSRFRSSTERTLAFLPKLAQGFKTYPVVITLDFSSVVAGGFGVDAGAVDRNTGIPFFDGLGDEAQRIAMAVGHAMGVQDEVPVFE